MSRFAANSSMNGARAALDYTPPVASVETLKRLREQRKWQRVLRNLAKGKWRDIMLEVSQGRYPRITRQDAKVHTLLVKLNLVGPAMRVHADVLAGARSSVTSPEGYDAQQEAINAIKARCRYDTLLHQVCEVVSIEGSAAVRVGVAHTSSDTGVVLAYEDNEVCMPVGALGADQQPSGWERRWVVEIPDPANPRNKLLILRVESHWRPVGSPVAVIAQRAYIVESADPWATCVGDAKSAKPFALDALAKHVPAVVGVEELTLLPGPSLDIVQIVSGRQPIGGSAGAQPRPRLSEHDLDMLDALTAQITQVINTMRKHGNPRLRVTEGMLDSKTGTFDSTQDIVVDPEGKMEYVGLEAEFEAMFTLLEKLIDFVRMPLRVAKALLDMSGNEGATPSTYGELRLNAQTTLTDARSSEAYITPALEHAWTTACTLDSAQPGGMYDVAPVSVRLTVGLFQGFADRVEDQRAALDAGVTSRWRAIAAVHGDENADAVLREIEADEARKADLAAKSLMSDFRAASVTASVAEETDPSKVNDQGASS